MPSFVGNSQIINVGGAATIQYGGGILPLFHQNHIKKQHMVQEVD